MAKKTYEIGEGGVEWASAQLGYQAELGESYEIEVDDDTAVIAAGWAIPSEPEKKEKK